MKNNENVYVFLLSRIVWMGTGSKFLWGGGEVIMFNNYIY